jgi:hypothetical protein
MISDAEEMTIKDDKIPLTSTLNVTTSFEIPPQNRDTPRIYIDQQTDHETGMFKLTRRLPERILPTILDWTILISPCLTAVIPTCAMTRMLVSTLKTKF